MESNLVQNLVNLKSLPETWAVKDFKEVVSDNSEKCWLAESLESTESSVSESQSVDS